jgi:hypothetical protein
VGRRDAADYESLRSGALHVGLEHGAILLRHGLAAWLEAAQPSDPLASWQLPTKPSSDGIARRGPLPATVAAIILRLTREAVHA